MLTIKAKMPSASLAEIKQLARGSNNEYTRDAVNENR